MLLLNLFSINLVKVDIQDNLIVSDMFTWMNKDEARKNGDVYEGVAEGLKNIYRQKLLPLEKEYQFHDFHSPALDDPDFDAK